ncbi:Fatty acid synthase 1 [Carabus blaptoides fortunei]
MLPPACISEYSSFTLYGNSSDKNKLQERRTSTVKENIIDLTFRVNTGYDSLIVSNHPLPELGSKDVAVDVYYCGVNFADLYTRQGLNPREQMPFVLGMECSGIITNVGEQVGNKFKVGDRVICYDYMGGLYRTKLIIPATKCYAIPDEVTLKEAAALFVNYLTAYFSVVELGNLRPNQHILINSCAGGVGLAATQLAKLVNGVTIYGTTSQHKTEKALSYGVNHVLQYDNYKEQLKEICPDGLDLIIDNQAVDNFTVTLGLLRTFGRIILIGVNNIIRNEKQLPAEAFQNMASQIPVTNLMMGSTCIAGLHLGIITEENPSLIENSLKKIFSLLSENKIELNIDSVWSMDDIHEATKVIQERRNIGKVLLSTDVWSRQLLRGNLVERRRCYLFSPETHLDHIL